MKHIKNSAPVFFTNYPYEKHEHLKSRQQINLL